MTTIFAKTALLPGGWATDVRITCAARRIATVEVAQRPLADDVRCDTLLPGLMNLHSHAFQRGMAGLAEFRGPGADSFWTWRDVMYRFALSLSPDQMEAIAALAYVEMLEAGFTRVGEFHYLHHAPDGSAYGDPAELAGRIVAAADATGLGLTLLPVFYAHGGFGGAEAGAAQRRFLSTRDSYARMLEASEQHVRRLTDGVVGIAPHSLRAVTPDQLAALIKLRPGKPLHIHIAEQTKEVDDCIAWSGQRPVAWLLAHADVDARWCLVHATHMTEDETRTLAVTSAVAGLCPITEANLGDGVFSAPTFLAAGGRFGVGSDSNVRIDAAGELCQLEYGQRLHTRTRNVFARADGSSGRALFDASGRGGAQALGAAAPAITVGASADLVALSSAHSGYAGRRGDAVLDTWVFASRGGVDAVWTAGVQRVAGGRHIARDGIEQRFAATLRQLAAQV